VKAAICCSFIMGSFGSNYDLDRAFQETVATEGIEFRSGRIYNAH
jgi:hypothetical protein